MVLVYTVIRFFFVYCLFLCKGMTLEDGLEESGVHTSHEKVCRTKDGYSIT